MANATAVAAYIVQKFNNLGNGKPELGGNNDLTNLKLQKLLYFAQVEHMKARDNKPLFEDEFEAWQYGPVIREIYNAFKQCGAYFITDFDIDYDSFGKVDEDAGAFLDKFFDKYSKFSAWALVDKTHKQGSPWSKIYADGQGDKTIIPKTLLIGAETM